MAADGGEAVAGVRRQHRDEEHLRRGARGPDLAGDVGKVFGRALPRRRGQRDQREVQDHSQI